MGSSCLRRNDRIVLRNLSLKLTSSSQANAGYSRHRSMWQTGGSKPSSALPSGPGVTGDCPIGPLWVHSQPGRASSEASHVRCACRFCCKTRFCLGTSLAFEFWALPFGTVVSAVSVFACGRSARDCQRWRGTADQGFLSRLKFCAVAVSSTSSLTPFKPRSLSRSSLRMRFISGNRISIFLRSRRDCWKAYRVSQRTDTIAHILVEVAGNFAARQPSCIWASRRSQSSRSCWPCSRRCDLDRYCRCWSVPRHPGKHRHCASGRRRSRLG